MKVLVTGGAGFIGFHLSKKLIEAGHYTVGIDNINDYYDINLKFGRLNELGINKHSIEDRRLLSSSKFENYKFAKYTLENPEVNELFKMEQFDVVVNLAAQAGVRYSLENPRAYIDSNIVGFTNILEACRHNHVGHLLYASSSSVYGLNKSMPFSVHDNVDHPVSLYAASKKSNELMAHTYSHLYNLPTTGLRFFTVYGPWGRPDMALFLFTKAIFERKPIDVYNNGNMKRDFTYVEDIVNGIMRMLDKKPTPNKDWDPKSPDPGTSPAPYKIYNIGSNRPMSLMDFIKEIETQTGVEAVKNFMPIQPGDVEATWANVEDLMTDFDYKPLTPVSKGIENFINWYKDYYQIK